MKLRQTASKFQRQTYVSVGISTMVFDHDGFKQEAQLSQRDRAMLRIIEYVSVCND